MATKKDVDPGIQAKIKEMQAKAEKEIDKIKKDLEKAKSQVEGFVKKNPEKAAMISAGVGVALGAALAMLLKSNKKK